VWRGVGSRQRRFIKKGVGVCAVKQRETVVKQRETVVKLRETVVKLRETVVKRREMGIAGVG
jgi:hypothetical protein